MLLQIERDQTISELEDAAQKKKIVEVGFTGNFGN